MSQFNGQWERAIFDPYSSETPRLIVMKLEIYNYLQDTTPRAKFQGGVRLRGRSGQI